MSDILLLFAYEPLSLSERLNDLAVELKSLGLQYSAVKVDENNEKEDVIGYQDQYVRVSLFSYGALINIPVNKYRDFSNTYFVWDNLEKIFGAMGISPRVWSFAKNNKFSFTHPINDNYSQVLNLILSKELLGKVNGNHLFVEESADKNRIVTVRYGFERSKEYDALMLKTMITTHVYDINNLKRQVLETNDLMFDVWHWAMNKDLLNFMDNPETKK